ncbi:MAG: hypothetical protein LJE96_00960 [Deltaproteobacteria bacterium]|nr:hypothetical protein [Deltaproteobacteria bacterium]
MIKKTVIFFVLVALAISGCVLDHWGKGPTDPAKVYYWYPKDTGDTTGMVSRGSSDNPVAYPVNNQEYYSYIIPETKTIIATGIAKNDRVYYWYEDNTTSIGTTDNPTKYKSYYSSNRDTNRELVGVGIAGDDRVYYWYSGGTTGWVSIGTSNDPTKHSLKKCFSNNGYCEADIVKISDGYLNPIAVAIDGFYDTVYYWYPDQTVSSGTSVNATKYKNYYNSNLQKEVVGIAIRNGK